MAFDIFISFCSEDKQIAESIKWALEQENKNYRVFMDSYSLRDKVEFHKIIRSQLSKSDLIIILLSDLYFTPGRYTLTELEIIKTSQTTNRSRKILPVFLPHNTLQINSLDPFIRAVNVYDPPGNIEGGVTLKVTQISGKNFQQKKTDKSRVFDSLISLPTLAPTNITKFFF